MKRAFLITAVVLLAVAAFPTLGTASQLAKDVFVSNSTDNEAIPTRPIGTTDVTGTVEVGNLPATQNVAGTVDVGNLPAVQNVAGTVGIDPAANTVELAGTPGFSVQMPAQPKYLDYSLTAGDNGEETEIIVGARMGVSSITVTNRSANPIGVTVFNSIMSMPGCQGTAIGGGEPRVQLALAPHSTLHNDYPTPLVFAPFSDDGPVCITTEVQGDHGPEVRVGINGFMQE